MKIRDTMLPVLRPVGGEEELNSIRESIESGWWDRIYQIQIRAS